MNFFSYEESKRERQKVERDFAKREKDMAGKEKEINKTAKQFDERSALFLITAMFKQGVCKTRTGYLRMADADKKMRIEKCG